MTQAIVRYLVLALMTWMVHKKIITQDLADSNLAAWVNFGVIVATFAGAIIWAFLERWYKGLLQNSPHPPANIKGEQIPTKLINDLSTNPPAPLSSPATNLDPTKPAPRMT